MNTENFELGYLEDFKGKMVKIKTTQDVDTKNLKDGHLLGYFHETLTATTNPSEILAIRFIPHRISKNPRLSINDTHCLVLYVRAITEIQVCNQ